MDVLVSFVMIILFITLTVINIMFFIKMWKMTNNVAKLKEQFSDYKSRYKLIKMIYKPNMDKNKLEKLIYNNLYEELYEMYKTTYSFEREKINYAPLIEVKQFYSSLYDKANINKHEILNIEKLVDFDKYWKL